MLRGIPCGIGAGLSCSQGGQDLSPLEVKACAGGLQGHPLAHQTQRCHHTGTASVHLSHISKGH